MRGDFNSSHNTMGSKLKIFSRKIKKIKKKKKKAASRKLQAKKDLTRPVIWDIMGAKHDK
jgi:hypothetical protein